MIAPEYFTWNFPHLSLSSYLSPLLHLQILKFSVLFSRKDRKWNKSFFFFFWCGTLIFEWRCLTVTQTKTRFQKLTLHQTQLNQRNWNFTKLLSSLFQSVSHSSFSSFFTSFTFVETAPPMLIGLLLACVVVPLSPPTTISQR